MATFYDISPIDSTGPLMRRLRERKGYSLRRFCEELGVDPGNWSRFERGKGDCPFGKVEEALTLLGVTGEDKEYHDVYCALVKRHPDPDVRRYIIEILGVR